MTKIPVIFLFPSDYFNPKAVDEAYFEQAKSVQNAGFETAVISLESLSTSSPYISPILCNNLDVVYRGESSPVLQSRTRRVGGFPAVGDWRTRRVGCFRRLITIYY